MDSVGEGEGGKIGENGIEKKKKKKKKDSINLSVEIKGLITQTYPT